MSTNIKEEALKKCPMMIKHCKVKIVQPLHKILWDINQLSPVDIF